MTVGARPSGLDRRELVAEVADVLGRVPAGSRVVIGASGGPDSAALLLLARAARADLDVVAVHVRHGLRDDQADLAAARAQADVAAATFVTVTVTVTKVAGDGLEAAAREARHAALQDQAARHGAAAVLLGHTADDQAETVLLRAARGTGLAGLGAMAAWRDHRGGVPVGRPMLRLRRADVRAVPSTGDVAMVDDPMNADDRFARTVVRHEVIPALERHAGDVVGALNRLADLAREDAEALDDLAARVVTGAVEDFGGVRCLPEAALAGQQPAIAQRVLRSLSMACGGPGDAATVAAIRDLGVGRVHESGVLVVSRGGGWFAFAPRDLLGPSPDERPLPAAPGRLDVGASLALVVQRPTAEPGAVAVRPPGGRADRCAVRLPAPGEGLPEDAVIRSRRRGDVVRTAAGTRSVQDLMVDHRVPRLVRDRVPVLASRERVLWVAGIDADVDLVRAGRQRPAVEVMLTTR